MIGDIQVIVSASTIIIIIALSESVSRVKCFAALDSLNFIKIVCFSVPYFTPSPESNNQHPIYKIDGSANRVIAKACQDLNSWFQGARTHLTILAPSSTFDTCWADNTNTLSGGFFFQPALPMLSLQADGIRPGLFSLAPDFDSGFDQPFQNSARLAAKCMAIISTLLLLVQTHIWTSRLGPMCQHSAWSFLWLNLFPSWASKFLMCIPAPTLQANMAFNQGCTTIHCKITIVPKCYNLCSIDLKAGSTTCPSAMLIEVMERESDSVETDLQSLPITFYSLYAMYFIKHNKFPESLTDEVLAVVIYAVQWELSGCLTGFYNPGHRFNEAPSRVYYDKALAAIQDLSSKERVILDGIFCALLVKGITYQT
ncbi:hypothetical protein SERLA73DRAFT_148872 [Serpula lacrymans var. lacrymans S7.3]|uniref:Uncharacterized protein n=1 Tax=Serpula lacrymans var. lacrymans (strain S7.3) TaxID=936435 RepID=F8PG49_SERL3|nr:hypothetical protein SERLA73DRAFT_148872 [Serpula lacrymans var. lacrymans S7.3]